MSQIVVADISRWQGTINFDEFKNHVQAVVIKASGSDGGLYADSKLIRNRDEARRVGLPAAYYHYKGDGTARDQADYFLAAIGNIVPGEFVVIDDENEVKVNPEFCRAFAARIKEVTGLVVPVYSNLNRFQNVDLSPIKDLPAWVAKYGQNTGTVEGAGAPPSNIGMNIAMWQYTSAARVPGITENTVDLNIFYGSLDDFKALGAKGHIAAPAPAPVSGAAPVATGDGTYLVQKGDTLSGIGGKLGQDWKVIAATNGIFAPYTIFPGQRLRVFGGAMRLPVASENSYTVVPNDNLSGIGVKTGVAWKTIADLNGIKDPFTIYPGQVLKLGGSANTTEETYTVLSGDNLSAIGSKTGRKWQDIAAKNNIAAPWVIYPGQVLRLP